MQILFTTIIDGLNLGSVYALVALGYSMVYGIAKMLNFAHGDVIMVGIYSIFVCLNMARLPAPVAMIVCVVICAVLGFVVEKLAYKPLRQSSSLSVLITAIGRVVSPSERRAPHLQVGQKVSPELLRPRKGERRGRSRSRSSRSLSGARQSS